MLVFSLGTAGTVLTALRLWKSVRVWQLNQRLDRSAFWQLEIALLVMLSYIEVCTIGSCANLPTLTGWWRKKRQRTFATATVLPATNDAFTSRTLSNALPRRSDASRQPVAEGCSTTATRACSVVTSGCGGGNATGAGSGRRDNRKQVDGISVACCIRMESMSATAAAAQSDEDGKRGIRPVVGEEQEMGAKCGDDVEAESAYYQG